jgi:PIN domain nuclease of toxin-antitoxin system
MRYLADTQLLIWLAISPSRLSKTAKTLLADVQNEVFFSTASIWETSIKFERGKSDFTLPPMTLRTGLLTIGYLELAITSGHTIAVAGLPKHHKDPFDRLLVAQAMTEGIGLLTVDKVLALYPNTIRV